MTPALDTEMLTLPRILARNLITQATSTRNICMANHTTTSLNRIDLMTYATFSTRLIDLRASFAYYFCILSVITISHYYSVICFSRCFRILLLNCSQLHDLPTAWL